MRLARQFPNLRRILIYADIRRAMRALGVGVLIAATAGSGRSVAQGLNAEEKETETIRGTVVNSVTHEPIGRALVYSPDNRFAMLSDAGGRFEFKIPRAKNEAEAPHASGMMSYYDSGDPQYYRIPTSIALMARRPGFLMDENSREGTAPNEAGQEVRIQLVPEALVVGRVNLPTADGTDQLQVELYKRLIQDGREVWNSTGTVQTRSNGEFRFAELAAGTYKVFTHEEIDRDPLTFNPRGQLYGYPPVYYPSSNDFATASAIRVTAGATVNVNLAPTRREYYSVKLGVSNPPQGAGLQIEVWPQGHPGPGYSLGYDPDQQAIVGMLPDGNYTIQATAFGPIALVGQINFNVKGGGPNGASLNLVPGGSIRVELKQEFTTAETASQIASMESFEGDGKALPKGQEVLRNVQVSLNQVGDFPSVGGFGARPPGPTDNSLLIENVRPGQYLVQARSSIGYVAAVNSGGTDLLHNPLVVPVGGTSSPIEITLRDDGGTLEGAIENWRAETQQRKINQPGQRPSCVYLLPASGNDRQPLIGWVSEHGSFNLQQIPPGTYRAIAFNRQPLELEFTNEEVMKKYEAKSQVIEFEAGERKQLRLPLNSTSD
jgi:hypothetical protein